VFASPRGGQAGRTPRQAKDSIDELCDRAPEGQIDLGGGVHKYLFRGNWKLQLENTVDMYHVPFSHESTVRRSGRQFAALEKIPPPRSAIAAAPRSVGNSVRPGAPVRADTATTVISRSPSNCRTIRCSDPIG
jgi:phenylpropionate dioxygenase-like ring-hydroxylating dioxygenase large terminal subunit